MIWLISLKRSDGVGSYMGSGAWTVSHEHLQTKKAGTDGWSSYRPAEQHMDLRD